MFFERNPELSVLWCDGSCDNLGYAFLARYKRSIDFYGIYGRLICTRQRLHIGYDYDYYRDQNVDLLVMLSHCDMRNRAIYEVCYELLFVSIELKPTEMQ